MGISSIFKGLKKGAPSDDKSKVETSSAANPSADCCGSAQSGSKPANKKRSHGCC